MTGARFLIVLCFVFSLFFSFFFFFCLFFFCFVLLFLLFFFFKFFFSRYTVTKEMLVELGGQGLLTQYGGSIQQMIVRLYPNHQWCEWKFSRVENNFWTSLENQRRYFDWLAVRLGITSKEKWYDVTVDQINGNYGGGLMAHHYGGSTLRALPTVYPEHNWDVRQFRSWSVRLKFSLPEVFFFFFFFLLTTFLQVLQVSGQPRKVTAKSSNPDK